jgi:hypothetical protein
VWVETVPAVQKVQEVQAVGQILGILKTLGYSSRQGAKTLTLEIFFTLRLRVFAGDTPNFCVLCRRFKFFAVKLGNQFFNPKFLAAISAML